MPPKNRTEEPEHVEWIPEDFLNVTASNPHGHNDLHVAKSHEFHQEQLAVAAHYEGQEVADPLPLPDQEEAPIDPDMTDDGEPDEAGDDAHEAATRDEAALDSELPDEPDATDEAPDEAGDDAREEAAASDDLPPPNAELAHE